MKDFVKYAAVGLAGYFIGFYEMKYNVIKAFAEAKFGIDTQDPKEKEEESK